MSRQFVITALTIILIISGGALAISYAKGYRFSPTTRIIKGTGIISITSLPDQASIFLNNSLTSATNTNINSLMPGTYDVRIEKESYIPWQKKVEVKEGLVTKIKATLFKAFPSIYPLTTTPTGVDNVLLSPDQQKVVYVIPSKDLTSPLENKRSGVWVWTMSEKPLSLVRSSEPHQISQTLQGIDFTKATFRWSPDSTQILVTLPDRYLLLDASKLNDVPKDVTATYQSLIKQWEEDQKARDNERLATVVDPIYRDTASSSAYLKWAPDESKFLYSKDGKSNFKVLDIEERKEYDMPQEYAYQWLPDSEHLVLVETEKKDTKSPTPSTSTTFPVSKVYVIESDGSNKADIYAGNFDPDSVFVWPDGSRMVVLTSFQTTSASKPNLFGINLK